MYSSTTNNPDEEYVSLLQQRIDGMKLNNLSENDKPREKMKNLGPQALTDAELLAILIGVGSVQNDVMELSRKLLEHCGNNLLELGKMTLNDFSKFNGLGDAKATKLVAAIELGRRRMAATPQERPVLKCSFDIFRQVQPRIGDEPCEKFLLMLISRGLKLIDIRVLSEGGISSTQVDIRKCVKCALDYGATTVALAHNHPGGTLKPSLDDDNITKRIKDAFSLIGIRILDHLIVSQDPQHYYSYADNGRL